MEQPLNNPDYLTCLDIRSKGGWLLSHLAVYPEDEQL